MGGWDPQQYTIFMRYIPVAKHVRYTTMSTYLDYPRVQLLSVYQVTSPIASATSERVFFFRPPSHYRTCPCEGVPSLRSTQPSLAWRPSRLVKIDVG
jgi:hypothetical protein